MLKTPCAQPIFRLLESPLYNVPAIIDHRPDGTSEAVSDSLLILNYLEQHCPSPQDTRVVQEENNQRHHAACNNENGLHGHVNYCQHPR